MLRRYSVLEPTARGSVQALLSDDKYKRPLPLLPGTTPARRIVAYRFNKNDLAASPFSVSEKSGKNVASFYADCDRNVPAERIGLEHMKKNVDTVTGKTNVETLVGVYGFDELPPGDEMGGGYDFVTANLSSPAYSDFWDGIRLRTAIMARGYWQERHSEGSFGRPGPEDALMFSAQRAFEDGRNGEGLAFYLHGLVARGREGQTSGGLGGVGEGLDERYSSGCCVFHMNAFTESSATVDMQVTVSGEDFVHVYDVKFLKLMIRNRQGVGWDVGERGSLDTARAAGTEYFLLVLAWVATL